MEEIARENLEQGRKERGSARSNRSVSKRQNVE